MVNKQYTAGEALNQIRLRMIYNSSKTLNENRELVTEQASSNLEYFETAAESLMNDPSQIKSINFGNPTANVKNAVTAIKNAAPSARAGNAAALAFLKSIRTHTNKNRNRTRNNKH